MTFESKKGFSKRTKIIIAVVCIIILLGIGGVTLAYFLLRDDVYTEWSPWSDCSGKLTRRKTRELKNGIFSKKVDNPVLFEEDDCLVCFNQLEFGEPMLTSGDDIITEPNISKDGELVFKDTDEAKEYAKDPLSRRIYLAMKFRDADGWTEEKTIDKPMKAFKRQRKADGDLGAYPNNSSYNTKMTCLFKNKLTDKDHSQLSGNLGDKIEVYYSNCDGKNYPKKLFYTSKFQNIDSRSNDADKAIFKPDACIREDDTININPLWK